MLKIGEKIPKTILRYMGKEGMESLDTHTFLKDKKAVLFGLPGAFTPTCSAYHLPGFIDAAPTFKQKSIDFIGCVAVNDAFVMHEWGRQQKVAEELMLLSDGNGEFSKELGVDIDLSAYGMGTRSNRYSMMVDHLVIQQFFVEENFGKMTVSSAENLLAHL